MRVLVMEDSWLIADAITDVLERSGISVVGPVPDITRGITLARSAEIDGAVLDIELQDGRCFGAATILRLRGIPFVFLSGHLSSDLVPDVLRTARHLQKPQDLWALPEIVKSAFVAA